MKILVFIFALLHPFTISAQNDKLGSEFEGKGQIERLSKISLGYEKVQPQEIIDYWKDRKAIIERGPNDWQNIGPASIISSEGINFFVSGRARKIEFVNENLIRIGTASGGIWEARIINGDTIIKNITEHQVPSPWVGAFATSPSDSNTIIVGTGEPSIKYGAGVWRSTDGGTNWIESKLPSFSGSFHDIQFSKIKNKVWMIGEGAYYSKDEGVTWTDTRRWNITGLAIDHYHPDTAMIGHFAAGVFRTFDGGKTWKKLGIGALPQDNLSIIKLSNSALKSSRVYALYCTDKFTTRALYRTDDFGDSWIKCNIIDDNGNQDSDIHGGLGWYANYVAVSPTNIDHAAIGGFWSAMTFDGLNFYGLKEPVHTDFHGAAWSKDGKTFAVATDGGVYVSPYKLPFDWNFTLTKIPTLQFGSVAVSKVNPNIILGGTQDNGVIYFDKNKTQWQYFLGDGGGVATHPTFENITYATNGLYGGDLLFRVFKNNEGTWSDINFGLSECKEWFRDLAVTQGNIPLLVTPIYNKLFYSVDGVFWIEFNGEEFNCKKIIDISITNEVSPKIIFNCYGGNENSGGYMVNLTGLETQVISYGLPIIIDDKGNNTTFPYFYTSSAPNHSKYMYALMKGKDDRLKNKQIFRSELGNLDWINISGNLPNVPYTTMLVHPYDENILFVGTDGFGLYSTNDGGKSWHVFDEGLPRGLTVSDMDYQIVNDSAFCVISTYGRGIFRKYIGNSITSTKNYAIENASTIKCINLNNDLILCSTSFTIKDINKIKIVDMQGRQVAQQIISISDNKFQLDVTSLSSGMYFIVYQNEDCFGRARFVKN